MMLCVSIDHPSIPQMQPQVTTKVWDNVGITGLTWNHLYRSNTAFRNTQLQKNTFSFSYTSKVENHFYFLINLAPISKDFKSETPWAPPPSKPNKRRIFVIPYSSVARCRLPKTTIFWLLPVVSTRAHYLTLPAAMPQILQKGNFLPLLYSTIKITFGNHISFQVSECSTWKSA